MANAMLWLRAPRLDTLDRVHVQCRAHRPTAVVFSSPWRPIPCSRIPPAQNSFQHSSRTPLRGDSSISSKSSSTQASSSSSSDVSAPAPPKQEYQWRWDESSDALRAYAVFLGILGLGTVLPLTQLKYVDLGYFVGLAVMTIYIGAHRGLGAKVRQQITMKEGILAPVLCSVALFGGYLAIKFFPDLDLKTIINGYFWLIGSAAVMGALWKPARQLAGPLGEESIKIGVPDGWLIDVDGTHIDSLNFAVTDFLVILLGVGVATLDLQTGHTNFTINNLLACVIATDILQLIGLRSFRTAAVMLLGLLLYDVFWVFGSPAVVGDNVMLTVATSEAINGPTRLLFPRPMGGSGEASFFPFSLLGLGDVAVPGLLACLALRYDATRATDMRSRALAAAAAMNEAIDALSPDATANEIADAAATAADTAFDGVAELEAEQRNRTDGSSTSGRQDTVFAPSDAVLYQRTYFTPVMFAYVLGLAAAFTANAVTNLGQPALLYLVPSTLLAILLTAVSRDEVDKITNFTDTTTAEIVQTKKSS